MKQNKLSNTQNKSLAIGVFDSGLGGVSVLNSIREIMPNENIIYYGDSAFAPYGTKDLDDVRTRVFNIVDELLDRGIKALVIACNTATSVCANLLREKYDIPILGLEPALKPAIESNKKNIIVLATQITIREKKFANLLNKYKDGANIYKFAATKLVDIVENDKISDASVKWSLEDFLFQQDIKKIDAVVLGCTHFIFAKEEISRLIPNAEIFDGNKGVSSYLKTILEKTEMLNSSQSDGETLFLSSDESMIKRFKKYAR